MKKRNIAFLTISALALMIVPAAADPVITPLVTSFLITDIGIGATTAALISEFAVGLATSIGLSYRSVAVFPCRCSGMQDTAA